MFKNNSNWNLQPVSLQKWSEKYALRDAQDKLIDKTVDDTVYRVARALATNEITPSKWIKEFTAAIKAGAIPAGRIMANAGANKYKPKTSVINCVVSATIHDNMESIYDRLSRSGISLKANCGIGHEYSTLRPRNARVTGGNAYSSGPISFMDVYSASAGTISSAGGRRGAMMATFDVHHPDIEEFIDAKREPGRLRQFNLSILITNDFIRAIKEEAEWPLSFPIKENECLTNDDIIYRPFPVTEGYVTNALDEVACKIYKTVNARELFNKIVNSNYEYDEPGYILIDEVNAKNNLRFCEIIRASNPCGEQMLQPDGACLLGSLNLSKFVDNPFTRQARLNNDRLAEITHTFSRMLDNVVDIANLPLKEQTEELETKRRHGMGIMGLDTAYRMLNMPYGSPEAIETEKTALNTITRTGLQAGIELAKEKGPAPILDKTIEVTPIIAQDYPRLSPGQKVSAKLLWANSGHHRELEKLGVIDNKLKEEMIEYGSRYSHQTSVAPTGTIALTFGDNISSGIEPTFADELVRNSIIPGKKTKEMNILQSAEIKLFRKLKESQKETSKELIEITPQNVNDITIKAHMETQAVAQQYMDSAISKTINTPPDVNKEHFGNIYLDAAHMGLKGCTVYRRDKNTSIGTILTTVESLKNQKITFELKDGETISCNGWDTIEYDGELHNAANLAEAIKEGQYGKF